MSGWSQEDMSFYYVSQGGSDFDDVVLWGDKLALMDALHKKEHSPHSELPHPKPARTPLKSESNYNSKSKPKRNKDEIIVTRNAYSDNPEIRRRQVGKDLLLIRRTFG